MQREKRTGIYSKNRLSDMPLDQLWDVFETTTDPRTKADATYYMKARGVDPTFTLARFESPPTEAQRQQSLFKAIDKKLATLTARQLHQVVTAPQAQQAHDPVKEYERYRAQQLLDEKLKQAETAASTV